MAGLYFDQFVVGQTFKHEIRRTVTEMDNMMFCSLTYNPAAIHIDHEYAKQTEFGKPLINSVFTLGLMVGLTIQDPTLGTTVGNLGWAKRSGRRRRSWNSGPASPAPVRASSRSSTAPIISATRRSPIAAASA